MKEEERNWEKSIPQRSSEQILDLLGAWAIEFDHTEALAGERTGLYRAVANTGMEYVVKEVGAVGSSWEEKTEIQYRVMGHLYRAGVPTGPLLTTRDGTGYTTALGSIFTLMPRILDENPGILQPYGEVVWDNAGRSYARLHQALETFDDPITLPRTTFYDRLYVEKLPSFKWMLSGSSATFVDDILDELEPAIKAHSEQLPEQVILWDCHTGNTLFTAGQVAGFIDCAAVCIGPRIFDIASLAVIMILWDQTPKRIDPWVRGLPHYVRAYQRTNPLSPAEQAALPIAFEIYALYRLWPTDGESEPEQIGAVEWLKRNRERVADAISAGFEGGT